MMLQQLQAHQGRMRGAREELNRGILNRELTMLQQQTNQERMIPPNAQTNEDGGVATRYDILIQMRIRAQVTATDASVFQSRSHDQQQAHHESMNHQPTPSNSHLSCDP
eukprot:scaffold94088_cov43-Cyclotella_meneghiniana.AAC.2